MEREGGWERLIIIQIHLSFLCLHMPEKYLNIQKILSLDFLGNLPHLEGLDPDHWYSLDLLLKYFVCCSKWVKSINKAAQAAAF